jgi:DNA-binding MarR family transcriptional regulator
MSRKIKVNQDLAKHVYTSCLCLALQHTARKIGRAYDDALRPLELTNGQFSLLMLLVREKPVSIGDLAPSLGMDRTTLTAYLKPLERRELVEVVANPEDARSRLPVLTDNGRKLLAQAIPLWEQVQQEAVDLLLGQKLDAFKIGLKSLAGIGSEKT